MAIVYRDPEKYLLTKANWPTTSKHPTRSGNPDGPSILGVGYVCRGANAVCSIDGGLRQVVGVSREKGKR